MVWNRLKISKEKMEEKINEYEINLDLDSGAGLRILLFNDSEHRWLFDYRYTKRPEKLRKPVLVNDINLLVDYMNGVSQKCELSMNMVHPHKLGKDNFLGVDVSKGAKLFVEFLYKKEKGLYRMSQTRIGNKILHSTNQEEGLVKQIDFPFPLKDVVENEFGFYEIPFLDNEGKEAYFQFPEDCRR